MLNGHVGPGDVVAVVGAGPIGLSAMMSARLYSPAHIVAIDKADSRLEAAKQFGADVTVNNGREDPGEVVASLTDGLGADVAIWGGRRAGDVRARCPLDPPRRPCDQCGRARTALLLHLEDLWIRNVTITTGLVDTYSTPTLLKLTTSHQLDAVRFVTHHFAMDDFMEAYDVFARAGETGALKIVLTWELRMMDVYLPTRRVRDVVCASLRRLMSSAGRW